MVFGVNLDEQKMFTSPDERLHPTFFLLIEFIFLIIF